MEKHGYVIDAAKTKDYVEGSAENISWLAGHGIKFEVVRMTPWEAATWHVISDYKGTNHGAGLIKGLKDAADKAGVETKLVVQSINTLSIKQMRTQCLQASISSGRSPVPHSLA